MGMTITEKILARAAGRESVKPGEILWCRVDKAMMDDILGPRVEIAEKLEELKAGIWDADRVTVISDHYTPPANKQQAEIVKFTREWAQKYGVRNYFEFAGPCHQVMVENGRVLPGEIIVGTDSHTCTYGALGAFSTGIGSTEMLGVLVSGEIWLKVPESIKVVFTGKLAEGVMAKDIALKVIGTLGHGGATYKALEFVGETFQNMIMDERLCIANMAVEAGAKNGIFPFDGIAEQFLKEQSKVPHLLESDRKIPLEQIHSDRDAQYIRELEFDAAEIGPLCACPHEVDNVTEIGNVTNVPVHQAYIGSCTGGRYHDLKVAADFLKGKKVAKGVRLLVSPASSEVWKRCAGEGILNVLSEAGAVILASSCGACLGVHSGAIGEKEVCISSTNRNFIGRMGSKEGEIYLASPLSVAAAAVAGKIVDPRTI